MSERIKELAEQAGADDFRLPHSWNYALVGIESIEKFAELIVRECAKIADHDHGMSGQELLEHFGVEE